MNKFLVSALVALAITLGSVPARALTVDGYLWDDPSEAKAFSLTFESDSSGYHFTMDLSNLYNDLIPGSSIINTTIYSQSGYIFSLDASFTDSSAFSKNDETTTLPTAAFSDLGTKLEWTTPILFNGMPFEMDGTVYLNDRKDTIYGTDFNVPVNPTPTPTPIPGAVWLLGSGLVGLLGLKRRQHRA